MKNLAEVLNQYNNEEKFCQLFEFWEQELKLRRQARETDIDLGMLVREAGDLEFLFRSLYFSGRPEDFFILLINNLQTHPVLQWLLQAPDSLKAAFLHFLPWYINKYRPEAAELQFLVSIYQDAYQPAYQAVANVLDLDTCNYLISRTANQKLRSLIKSRQEQLIRNKQKAAYSIPLEAARKPVYATLYGDKLELLANTFESMQAADSRNFHDPYGADRFGLLLETAEMLFNCGLLEDCLLSLADTYIDYQRNNRLVKSLEDERIYRLFFRILRRAIPCFALLNNPSSAWSQANRLYNEYFARLEADLPSLQYLNVYESIAAAQQPESRHITLEIVFKSLKIREFRPGEPPLLSSEDLDQGMDRKRFLQLEQLSKEKLSTLPHEAFIIAELLRLLQRQGFMGIEPGLAQSIFNTYLQLWKWVPCQLFMNHSIVDQLASRLDDSSRQEAERILSLLQDYNNERMQGDLKTRPELFRKRSENIRRELFIGKFLGLL